jgi:hypothetical protein
VTASGAWKALPQGRARVAPWQAPQAASRPLQTTADNWHALSAYQQIVRGIGEQPIAASAPTLGRFGFASAVAAAFVALFISGPGCASELVSVRMSTPGKTAQLTYTDDNVLAFISKGQCAAGARPPTRGEIRTHLAGKCSGGPSIGVYDVRKCPDGGWSWHIEISCDMSNQPEAERRFLVIQLKQLAKLAGKPGAEINLNWLPMGSSKPSTDVTPRPGPRPEPRPEPRRPASDEGDNDEMVF